MHRIRMAALGAAVVLGFGVQAQAQQAQPRQQQGERARRGPDGMGNGGFLLRGIELTDAQKTQAQAIGAKYREQRQALRPQDGQRPDSAARAQRLAQGLQIAQRQQAELRAVLTPAQQAQFDRNVAEARERMQQRGERGARGARGERGRQQARGDRVERGRSQARGVAARRDARPARAGKAALRGITLTDAQRTQFASLRTKQKEQRLALVKSIRADGQKPDSAERARVRDLAQRQRGELRTLLTPAQQQRFDANVADRKDGGKARAKKGGRGRRS